MLCESGSAENSVVSQHVVFSRLPEVDFRVFVNNQLISPMPLFGKGQSRPVFDLTTAEWQCCLVHHWGGEWMGISEFISVILCPVNPITQSSDNRSLPPSWKQRYVNSEQTNNRRFHLLFGWISQTARRTKLDKTRRNEKKTKQSVHIGREMSGVEGEKTHFVPMEWKWTLGAQVETE